MIRFLPLIFLVSIFSIFAVVGIVWYLDPDVAQWYVFAAITILVFISIWGLLGILLYFLRTKLYKRYSASWYFYTSFKMAFFVALFVGMITALALIKLVTSLNLLLTILAVSLFALWSYLGKRIEK